MLVPGVAIAASSALGKTQQKTVVQDFESGNILTPVDDGLRLDVQQDGTARRLTWTDGGPWRSDVFYRVYRHDGPGDDTVCLRSGDVAWYCFLSSEIVATTRDLSFVDPDGSPDRDVPGRGRHELGRRPGGRRHLRVQPSGCRSRLRRSSRSAIRCARSTFSSVSREITVE